MAYGWWTSDSNIYSKKLKLNASDLQRIGIVFPEGEGEYPIEKRTKKGSNDAIITLPYCKCELGNENANKEYVYSYGIKQILSIYYSCITFRYAQSNTALFLY